MFTQPWSLTLFFHFLRDQWASWLELPLSIKKWCVFLILGISLIIFSWVWLWRSANKPGDNPQSTEELSTVASSAESSRDEAVFVDVSGAVVVPGVYQLHAGQLVVEAIAHAGGWSSLSDQQYIHQKLNLAEEIKNNTKLYIPFQGEREPQSVESNHTPVSNSQLNQISINSATLTELDQLPGVGEKRAEEIIQNRPYQVLDELVSRKILSQTLFDEIKAQLSL